LSVYMIVLVRPAD